MHLPACRRVIRFLLVFLLALCLPALVAQAQRRKATPKPTPSPTATPAAAVYVLPDPVARVNGEAISKAELERVTDAILASSGRALKDVPESDKKRVYTSVLDNIITDDLASAQAASEKVDDMDVEKQFNALRASYTTQDAFDQDLKKSGRSADQVRQSIRKQLAQRQWVDAQIADQIKVTPEEVEKFYKDGPPEKFDTPEVVRASHILIAVRQDAPPEDVLAAETRANDIEARLKKGEKFEDLARDYSADPNTKLVGGDLGYFGRDRIMPNFAEAAFKLKVGEVSDPVRTQFGLHIIKVTDRKAAHTATLNESGDQIKAYIEGERRRYATEKLVQSLKDKAKIEIFLP